MTLSRFTSLQHRRRTIRRGALALCLLAQVAWGYILPGGSVLRRMAEAREDLHVTSLRAEGALTFFGPSASEAAAMGLANPDGLAEATFAFKPPGRCRLEFGLGEGAKSAWVVSRGQRRSEGKEIAFLATTLDHVCALLGGSGDRGELERYLKDLKVEWRSTSLDRLNRDVAYVLGGSGKDDPQLWVFKDIFAPARIRFTDAQGVAWDLKLLDYESPQGGATFPRVIEVMRAGELLARFTTARTDQRVALPDRLF